MTNAAISLSPLNRKTASFIESATASFVNDEERLLIKACCMGNKNAQYKLYRLYSSKMFNICLRYAPDFHSAEDLLQEGFVKVFAKIDQYQQSGSLYKWMQRIFVNTAIDQFRQTTRHIEEAELASTYDIEINQHIVDSLLHEDLLKVVQALPTHYRTVFNLYVIEGYSHEEISKMLHIPKGTSKSHLSRARVQLQGMLQQFS